MPVLGVLQWMAGIPRKSQEKGGGIMLPRSLSWCYEKKGPARYKRRGHGNDETLCRVFDVVTSERIS